MNEELYEPLPSAEAYLDRIGISAAKTPSTEFLDELIDAHQHTVPFEDLDVFDKHAEISLGKADLFDKIVTRKRGGYCFELNGLFYSLLVALGFDVRASMARVLTRPNPYPVISHRANIVRIDGQDYLADVGFGGPMPSFAPRIADGASRSALGQTFTLHKSDDFWWNVTYSTTAGEEKPAMCFCTMPVGEHDFIPLSYYQAQNPQSAFRLRRMVNISTPTGAINLSDTTLTEYANGTRTITELPDDAALDQALAEKFNIKNWR